MFKALKSKLKSWMGNDAEKEEQVEETQEEVVETPKEDTVKKDSKKDKKQDAPKKATKKTATKKEESAKEKALAKDSAQSTPQAQSQKTESSEAKELPTEEELKKEVDKIEKEVPQKFALGKLKAEPDVKAIKQEGTKEEPAQEMKKKGFLKRMFSSDKKEKDSETLAETINEIEQVAENTVESLKEEETQAEESEEKSTEKSPAQSAPEAKNSGAKKGFFAKLSSGVKGETTITHEHIDEMFEDLEMILLENNVALEVVDKIKETLTEELVGQEMKKNVIEQKVIEGLRTAIEDVLIEPPDLVKAIKEHDGVYTIIFFGINGSGKTTSIAKLAHKLKSEGIDCVLAACDTFRAAAIQQLETHATNLNIPIIKHDYESDPTAVAFDAKKYAEKHKKQCLLIDTAGRMYTKDNLIKQMEKMMRVISPELKIFVGESITGNDGVTQAKTFNEAVGIDGVILSKADVDEKAGTILSISYVTGKPIYYLGIGQEYKDLQPFSKETVLKNVGLA